MAKRNVYSVICLDEYYNLGSFRTVFRFNHYINLVLKLNLSEQYLSMIYNNLSMTIDCYFEIIGFKFKTSNNHLYIASSDRGSIYNNHSNLNSIRNIVQYIHNIPHEQIQVGFQFTDCLDNTLKVVCSGDSNV